MDMHPMEIVLAHLTSHLDGRLVRPRLPARRLDEDAGKGARRKGEQHLPLAHLRLRVADRERLEHRHNRFRCVVVHGAPAASPRELIAIMKGGEHADSAASSRVARADQPQEAQRAEQVKERITLHGIEWSPS